MHGDVRCPVGKGGPHELGDDLRHLIRGRGTGGAERPELDRTTRPLDRRDCCDDVHSWVPFDERLDGELKLQHAPNLRRIGPNRVQRMVTEWRP